MTRNELIALLKVEVKGLTSYLVDDDYSNAVDDALRDTGWTLPTTVDFKEKWLKDRSKRHLFFYLQSESAHKFKFEQINLQHRFEHYDKLISTMDKAFEKAIEDNPDQFSGVDAFKTFGHQIDAGFAYDGNGQDITYDSDQRVLFGPNETD